MVIVNADVCGIATQKWQDYYVSLSVFVLSCVLFVDTSELWQLHRHHCVVCVSSCLVSVSCVHDSRQSVCLPSTRPSCVSV